MSSPRCDDCHQPATAAIRDHSRGWGNKANPHRRICRQHLADLLAHVDPDDPWAPTYPVLETYEQDTTMTDQPLSDRLAPLAAEYADLAEKSDAIKARQEEIKAAIRDLVPGPDTYQAGDLSVAVAANRRFDEERALRMLPEAVAPLVTYPATRVDKDKLRALAPDVFEAAQVTFAERVTVKTP